MDEKTKSSTTFAKIIHLLKIRRSFLPFAHTNSVCNGAPTLIYLDVAL
jgi:hypothetical protein